MIKLREDEASLVHELPYWEVRNGLVVLSDGSYEVGVGFELPPSTLWPTSSLNHLAYQIRVLLRGAVPEGERLRCMVEIGPEKPDRIIRYASRSGAHPASRFLHLVRSEQLREALDAGRLVAYRGILSCTYHPPRAGRRSWEQVNSGTYKSHLSQANLIRQVLLANLERAGIKAWPLQDQDLVEAIWRYFNPERRRFTSPPAVPHLDFEAPQEILRRAPHMSRPTLRSQVVTSDVARRWNYLWCDDHYVMIVSMDQLPLGETHVGMISPLLMLPCWYWLVLDFVHDPYGQAVRALEAHARRLYAQSIESGPISDYTDPRVRVGFGEADTGLQHAYSSGSHLFHVGASVVIFGKDLEEVRQVSRKAVDAFGQLHGLKAIIESAGLWQQFIALAPFSGKTNERAYRVFEENAADFFPVSGPWEGQEEPVCMFYNRWDGLTSIDPFDPHLANWNAIVAGSSGSGKTFFVQSLLAQLLMLDLDAIIIDRGGGYEWLARALDAQIIPMDPSSGVSINPFDLPDGVDEPDADKKAFLLALVRSIVPPVDPRSEPIENAILESAILQTYARATSEQRDPKTGELRRRFEGCTLSDLTTTLVTMEEVGDRPMSAREREVSKDLASRLQHWTGQSAFGQLLDRPTNVRLERPILYFDTTGLERYQELRAPALLILSDLIWRRVQQTPQRKKIVVIDEAWALLSLPQAARFIGELYRRFRRYGAAVYTITQSLADFRTESARGILENTTYHFLLQLPKELELAGELFGLPDRALQTLARLGVQKGVYGEVLVCIRSGDRLIGDVLVNRPTGEEYWMFTTFDRDIPIRARAIEEEGGDILRAIERLAKERQRRV